MPSKLNPSAAIPNRSAMPAADLSPVYGPEGKEGEGVQQRGKSAFACVENFGQVRDKTSRLNVLNVLMSCFLLKFSAKTGVLGHLARHGEFGADDHLRASVGAGQHELRKFRSTRATTHCNAGQRRGTMRVGAEYTIEVAGNLPDSEVFSRPEFGNAALRRLHGFGRDALVRKAGGMATSMYSTSRHPLPRLNNGALGSESQVGAETMTTVTTVASPSAAPITRHLDPIALHGEAINAAAMARWYAARHDYAAAFRRSAQATGALRRLATFERQGAAA